MRPVKCARCGYTPDLVELHPADPPCTTHWRMSCRCKAPQPAVFFFEDEQGLDAAVKAWNLLQALLRK